MALDSGEREFAVEHGGARAVDFHGDEFADEAFVAGEVHDAVAARAAHVAAAFFVGTLDKDFLHCAEERGIAAVRVLLEHAEQRLVALLLHGIGHLVGQGGGGRAGPDGILEDVGHVVIARLEQLARLSEILVRLAGEADDDIGGKIHGGPHAPEVVDDLPVALARVGPVHRAEDAVAAGLQRQVDVFAEFLEPAVGGDEVVLEPARMRRGEADAAHAGDGVDALEQLHEGRDAAGMEVVAAPVAGDDLAEERDLAHAAFGEFLALAHDLVHRP